MRFYRILKRNPPDRNCFLSPRLEGRSKPAHVKERTWDGVSVFDSVEEVERQARKFRKLGGHVAELEIPDWVSREGPHDRGHWDIFAQPDEFVAWVLRVWPVR